MTSDWLHPNDNSVVTLCWWGDPYWITWSASMDFYGIPATEQEIIVMLDNFCWPNPNPTSTTISDLANQVGSGAIAESSNVLNGPIGYVIYFVIGISLLWVVVFAVRKWF